jgi:hypothetical protein
LQVFTIPPTKHRTTVLPYRKAQRSREEVGCPTRTVISSPSRPFPSESRRLANTREVRRVPKTNNPFQNHNFQNSKTQNIAFHKPLLTSSLRKTNKGYGHEVPLCCATNTQERHGKDIIIVLLPVPRNWVRSKGSTACFKHLTHIKMWLEQSRTKRSSRLNSSLKPAKCRPQTPIIRPEFNGYGTATW